MMAALRKAFDMGSDSEQKLIGIQAKCKEFINLEYPPGILKFMCVRLYHQTGHTVWLIAKGTIMSLAMESLINASVLLLQSTYS